MKYKIGDKVRVREDLKVGKFYNEWFFNEEMAELKGKVVEIEDVDSDFYYIKEDGYYWSDEMFSGLADEPRNLIPLIAKELGVEMGEEFKISNQHYVYKFTEDGLIGIKSNGTFSASCVFLELISGKGNIIKLPPKPKLTEAERVILENIPKKYKYIARDAGGALYLYEKKPKKDGDEWFNNYSFDNLNLFQHLFQFIKFEDKEAYKIQELLEEYEKGKNNE